MPEKPQPPISNEVLKRALTFGVICTAGVLIVAGVIGLIFAGIPGFVSAIVGTILAVVFMGLTALSIVIANRFAGTDMFVGVFFGIVMGGWLLKFVVFLVLVVLLRGQPWLNPTVLFLSTIAGVIASLVVDVLVVAKSRMPNVSDIQLPEAPED